MSRPKRIKDWKGGYIKSKYRVDTGQGIMPPGTIFKITEVGPTVYLEMLPCPCCRVALKVNMKGKNKFDHFIWLGYDEPKPRKCSKWEAKQPKIEAMKLVLAGVAVKAGISDEKLEELLNKTLADVQAVWNEEVTLNGEMDSRLRGNDKR
jgi:hypothetical protein